MVWLDVGDDGPLIAVRAIHFAATAVMTGPVVFRAIVAVPLRLDDSVPNPLAWCGLRWRSPRRPG